MRILTPIAALALILNGPAMADEVTDTIASALTAYEEGDIAYAIEELDFAKQLMVAMQTTALAGFLPPAPEGWTVEVNSEGNPAMAMFGGGSSAEGRYTNGSETITLTIMMDSPMVASMAGMMNNTAVMSQMGTVRRMGRQRVLDNGRELSMLLNGRILVQASGGDSDRMFALFEQIDIEALGSFGQ